MAQPNIIVIMTDDQRFDFLSPVFMPRTMQRLVGSGVSFTNAFATTALCGPSRMSFLTGDLASIHGAQGNAETATDSVGPDANTIATRLHDAGYYTAIVGKYLNGYEALGPPNALEWYIPPGWDSWDVLQNDFDSYIESVFVTGPDTTQLVTQYSTDWIAERAKFLLQHKPANQPAFLLVTPFGPHLGLEMQPARYADVMGKVPLWRPPNFNEPDVSDKASVLQAQPQISDTTVIDTNRRAMLEALLAVDDLVEVIWRVVESMEQETVIVFMSDQGFFFGEHRLTGKAKPYDEAHRIPLVISYPGVLSARIEEGLVTSQDVTQTLLAWGEAEPLGAAGVSMAPRLVTAQPLTRASMMMEGYEPGFEYQGVRTLGLKFFTWTGVSESELYDVVIDPYELQNLLSL